MADIWIVNDFKTCVPGTRTFWHMLLEIPGTVDKTGHHYPVLAANMERDSSPCDLIIRNGSFFRPINKNVKQIALIQDRFPDDPMQKEVCQKATHVVFNSIYTARVYEKELPGVKSSIIPLGVDENVFKPMARNKLFNNEWPVGIFVGDYNPTKNTQMFEAVCRARPYVNFIYVSKQGYTIKLPNVYNVAGGADEQRMVQLYNSADFCIMMSPVETLHLTTIEAALCNKPVIGSKTGWFADYFDESVGVLIDDPMRIEACLNALDALLERRHDLSPREHILKTPFSWTSCKNSWQNLINTICSEQTIDNGENLYD